MRFPYAATVIALVWVGVAWLSPTTNFFLFPFFTGIAIPLTQRIARAGVVSPQAALAMGTAGFANGAIAALMLSFAGKLAGEPLGWLGPILVEGIVLSLAGGVLGAAIARTP